LQSLDHGTHVRRCSLDQSVDGFVETGKPLAHVQDLGDAISQCHLLGFVLELERLDPAPPRVRPGSTLFGLTQTATKQVLGQTVLGAALIGFRGGTLTNEISQCLVLGRGHPDRRKVAGLVGLGKFLGVPAIGFHLVTGLLGDERRCDDLAVDAKLGELPVPSMITSKAATNDHPKTGHHEVTEAGSV
jgi:hypothetical protein